MFLQKMKVVPFFLNPGSCGFQGIPGIPAGMHNLVARIAFANNTAIIITVVALSGRRHRCLPPLPLWWKKHKSTVLHIFLHFALAMTIVSLTANAIVTMMATAPAMIYHCLFYDSYDYDDSGNYIFFILQWRKLMEGEEEIVVVFAMAMIMVMLTITAMVRTTTMVDYWLLLKSNGMIAANIFSFYIQW